ncbi:MAG: nitroreductase family protein [Clostridiales bacterium]|nr:nitroreductase family protein [Clostridiales bacterium]
MNQIIELMHSRKSVRAYEEREISPEDKRAILEAAIQAPSAGNMNLYTILDITDQKLKEHLAVTCDNQPFIAKAKMVLIFCADYRRWYDVFREHEDEVRKPAHGDLLLAQADAFIAAQNAAIAAESLGIGSCYIGDITENFEIHKELLSLPQYVVPTAMLVFGYPTEQQLNRPKPGRFAVEDVVHENGYDMAKAARMDSMLMEREGKTGEEFADWVRRFCKRKWNSDFSVEMSRSCKAMIEDWCGEE